MLLVDDKLGRDGNPLGTVPVDVLGGGIPSLLIARNGAFPGKTRESFKHDPVTYLGHKAVFNLQHCSRAWNALVTARVPLEAMATIFGCTHSVIFSIPGAIGQQRAAVLNKHKIHRVAEKVISTMGRSRRKITSANFIYF